MSQNESKDVEPETCMNTSKLNGLMFLASLLESELSGLMFLATGAFHDKSVQIFQILHPHLSELYENWSIGYF